MIWQPNRELERIASRYLSQKLMTLSQKLQNAIDIELDAAVNSGTPKEMISRIFDVIQENQEEVINN